MINIFEILVDTNNKSSKHPEEDVLRSWGFHLTKTSLPCGDYVVLTDRYREVQRIREEELAVNGKSRHKNMKLDAVGTFTRAVDTKQDFNELAKNLLNSKMNNKGRFQRELLLAKHLGVKMHIVIADDNYSTFEDMRERFQAYGSGWFCGEVICNKMTEYMYKYGCEFILCKKHELANVIINCLKDEPLLYAA